MTFNNKDNFAEEDNRLARQACTDRDAFAELYRRHVTRVYRYFLATPGTRTTRKT